MQIHLNSYGTYLHVKDAMFDVRKKQEDGTWSSRHLSAHKVKSIWMGRGTSLSSDAAALALVNNIDIVFLQNDGVPLGRIWHSRIGSTTLIRKKQLEMVTGPQGVEWTKTWLGEKLNNQAQFIKDLKKHRPQHHAYLQEKIEKIEALQQAILLLEANQMDSALAGTLHGLEGTAGRLYFEVLSKVMLSPWQFAGRSSRPAQDPFNAFLNYAYGVLYARVEKSIVLAGLDPYLGILHRDDYNHKSMVFDFIEPFRIWADKTVFTLFSGKKVNQSHFDQLAGGGYSLNQEGKKLLMEQYNDYLEKDVIRYKNRNRTRATILLLEAHRFAQAVLGQPEADFELDIQNV
jgi:CRISP-associated protein Cas1